MITQVCNLSCRGCTNYSDLRHSGYVTWAQGEAWFEQWSRRLDMPDIGVMGGEPLMNPEWREWLQGLRDLFPRSQLRFTTNGLLLHRHPDILDLLNSIGNIVFKITVHLDDKNLEDNILDLQSKGTWWDVIEHGINRRRNKHGVRLQINRPREFVRPFCGTYTDMRPWLSNPDDAFDACIQQTCPLMYQGRIYKCSTSALLLDTLIRFGRPNWSQWQPFISTGIGVDDPDDLIQEFLKKFGSAEAICAQCPGKQIPVIDHQRTVRIGKI